MTTRHAEDYPEHDRTSCSDANPCNATAEGSTGCARCTALVMDRARPAPAHPLADKLAAIAQGDTYDEAALNEAHALLKSIRERAGAAMYGIHLMLTGHEEPGRRRVADAAVLLAAVEPLYASKGGASDGR